jgi:phosphatidylglycerophosphate synthase
MDKTVKAKKKKAARPPAAAAAAAGAETATPPPGESPAPRRELTGFSPVLCLLGDSALRLFGRSLPERLKLQFAREGITAVKTLDEARDHNGPIILVRADCVLDPPLIQAVVKRPQFVLLASDDSAAPLAAHIRKDSLDRAVAALQGKGVPAGLLARRPGELDAQFWKALRKREVPYALTATADTLKAVAWRVFMGTYKGATDLVTKHVWPRPAFHVTSWLAERGVTPNMVTTVGAIATVLAFVLFWRGDYALGLIAAWAMTFLDTVDGKLARTTLTSSKWGDVFDHGIDLIHPPFWYVAWALGLAAWGMVWPAATFWWVIVIILGGYVLQRVMEGIAIKWLGLEIHIWRPIDTLFRQVTARRNPNLILLSLSVLTRRPDWGLLAVAAWTLICLVLHGLQLAQALRAKAKQGGGPLVSWMTRP